MVLLEVLLLSVAVLSNLFRVLAGDVSCAWPASDFLCFFPYGVFWDRFLLATLAHLHIAFSFISLAVVFYFLGIIKVTILIPTFHGLRSLAPKQAQVKIIFKYGQQ